MKHLIYIPFTGLGLYGGFRGNRWLRNRLKIFKQFVIPSLAAQTSQDFTLWFSWRREERNNPIVEEFMTYLKYSTPFTVVHTFAGLCFYDDKYEDEEARHRLIMAIHDSIPTLLDYLGDSTEVLMTIQPSDDLYHHKMVEIVQKLFTDNPQLGGLGFNKGYICNYNTKEVSEYNPTTNPPFYTIKFPKDTFLNPRAHLDFTSLKNDVGKYKKGTPCPSHEYVPQCVPFGNVGDMRGFLVGTHGENVSTTYVHPFRGERVSQEVLKDYGIYNVDELKIKFSLRKRLLKKLPHNFQKKLRFLLGEKTWNVWYNFLRS